MMKHSFPTPLILLRHGQTYWNKERRMQGKVDINLNETGQAQANAYGKKLKTVLQDRGLDANSLSVRASPLRRAQETVRRACEHAGITSDIETDERLAEQNFGVWEGLTYDEAQKRDPEIWAARLRDPLSYQPQGGESGEQVKARMSEAIFDCSGPTLLVGHFGLIRVIVQLCRDYGFEMPSDIRERMGGQNLIYWLEDGKLSLIEA